MKITFISWAPYCSRSDHIARELGGSSHMVYLSRFGSHPATVAFKYAGQLLRTLEILRAERPEAVFVMGWEPTPAEAGAATDLADHHGVAVGQLTDCTVCHY